MLDPKNIAILESLKTSIDTQVVEVEEQRSLTFCNMTGDITLTWDKQNDERIKELIRAKMKDGLHFFTMRKVIIDAVQIKRKVGAKGVDKLNNLVIDDETFEKMVKGIDDRDLAEALNIGTAKLAKRRGDRRTMDAMKRVATAEEVMEAKQAIAIRPIVGG